MSSLARRTDVLSGAEPRIIIFLIPFILLVDYSDLFLIIFSDLTNGLEVSEELPSRLLVLALLLVIVTRARYKILRLNYFHLFLLLGGSIFAVLAPYHMITNPKSLGVLYIFAFYILSIFWAAVDKRESAKNNIRAILFIYLWITIVLAIILNQVPYFNAIFEEKYNSRLPGPNLNPNNLGFYAVLLIYFCISYSDFSSTKKKLLALIFPIFVLVESASRAAFISLLIFLFISTLLGKRPKIISEARLSSMIVFVGVVGLFLLISEIELFSRLIETGGLGSAEERYQIWIAGFMELQGFSAFELIFGKGHGGFNYIVGNSPHNTIFRFFFDYGILGAVYLFMAFIVTVSHFLSGRVYQPRFKIGLVLAGSFYTLTYDPLISLDNSIAVHLFVAYLLLHVNENEQRIVL